MHSHWRDKQAWKTFGLDMSTASDEACKWFDASLTQFSGFHNDSSLGGLSGSMEKMLEADPDFSNQDLQLNVAFQSEVNHLKTMAEQPIVTLWERKHVDALQLGAKGHLPAACQIWEDILVEQPLDLLALKLSTLSYYLLGFLPQLRDTVASVLPHWNPSIPNHSFIHGMMAFGLEENNLYDQAEKSASKALSINQNDIWAAHAKGHVYEMQGRHEEGIEFLEKMEDKWSCCDMLSYHVYWHLALYYIEKADYTTALEIYKKGIHPQVSKYSGIKDSASLLYHLELEDVDCSKEWKEVFSLCPTHINDHMCMFKDLHLMMSCLGANEMETAHSMMDSLSTYISTRKCHNQEVTEHVGKPLCEALLAYKEGDYGAVVDLMMPIRFQFTTIGGSNAQRDILNQLLIVSAIKSPVKHHHYLARNLLHQRKTLRENSPYTDRLIAKIGNVL